MTQGNAPVVFEYRCKICNLAKTHADLFKDLHIQVLEVGSSLNRAMNYINNRIDSENLQIAKLNNQNMSVHFASHITLPERVASEVARSSPTQPSLMDVNPEVGTFVQDIVRRKVGNEVNDYLNLDTLRAQLLEKLELLDGIVEKETSSGVKVVDMDAVGYYVTLAKEIRSCIVDLNKIRQSKQLMSTIIKSLIEKNTFQTVREITLELENMKSQMLKAGISEADATNIDQQFRIKLAQIVATTARAAVEDVSKMYKLS